MKQLFIAALARCLCLRAGCARARAIVADKYPEKPIRIIVPFAPGGSVDTLGRLLAQRMKKAGASPSWSRTGPAPPT